MDVAPAALPPPSVVTHRCINLNYNDAACAIACFKGTICGAGGSCFCKNQDPLLPLQFAAANGVCLGTSLASWVISGTSSMLCALRGLRRAGGLSCRVDWSRESASGNLPLHSGASLGSAADPFCELTSGSDE